MRAEYENDSIIFRRLIDGFGIDPARLVSEPLSRNTYENAVNTTAILKRENLGPCLLVTSAFHMPRAVGMFRKVGGAVIPWPTDYRAEVSRGFRLDFTEPMTNLDLTTTGLLEWWGLIGNYLAGRTDSLFPAP